MRESAVLLGITEGMFSVDLPRYMVEAIGMRTNALKLHIMKHGDTYEYFINDKKILPTPKQKEAGV